MSISAILTMVIVQVGITLITFYFFSKVLKKPPGSAPKEPESGD